MIVLNKSIYKRTSETTLHNSVVIRIRVSRLNVLIYVYTLSVAQSQTQCPAARGDGTRNFSGATHTPCLCLVSTSVFIAMLS